MQKVRLRLLVPSMVLFTFFFLAGGVLRHQWGGSNPQHLILARAISSSDSETSLEPMEIFQTVLETLKRDYVDQITDKDQIKLTYGALQGMVEALNDPYSRFLRPEEHRFVQEAQEGKFHGLNAIVLPQRSQFKEITYYKLTIVSVVPGGIADQAGLKAGDVISQINGRYFFDIPNDVSVENFERESLQELLPLDQEGNSNHPEPLMNFQEAIDLLSKDGHTLKLTVKRNPTAKPLEITLKTGPFETSPLEYKVLDKNIGYIHLKGFFKNSSQQLREALLALKEQKIRSLVVDLRNNVGGLLREAVESAGLFVKGPVGYLERKKGAQRPLQPSTSPIWSLPVVVLTDRSTIGVAEFFASALKEGYKARLVGQSTFGDGLEQILLPLPDGSALQLTAGKFYTRSHRAYNNQGISPNVIVEGSPETVLKKGISLAQRLASLAPPLADQRHHKHPKIGAG